MRNSYDEEFASDADYRDGFVESDAARAERLGLGSSSGSSNRSQGPSVANVQADGANVNVNINIAPKFDFSREPSNMDEFMKKLKAGYHRSAEERMSDELLQEQEDSEYRFVDEAQGKGYLGPKEMLEVEGKKQTEAQTVQPENKAAKDVMNKAAEIDEGMSATERYNSLDVKQAASMSDEELSELARQAQEESEDAFDDVP